MAEAPSCSIHGSPCGRLVSFRILVEGKPSWRQETLVREVKAPIGTFSTSDNRLPAPALFPTDPPMTSQLTPQPSSWEQLWC